MITLTCSGVTFLISRTDDGGVLFEVPDDLAPFQIFLEPDEADELASAISQTARTPVAPTADGNARGVLDIPQLADGGGRASNPE